MKRHIKDGSTAGKRKRAPPAKNNNPEFPHVFTQESLKHLTVWKIRKTNHGNKQYIAPFGKPLSEYKQVERFIKGEPVVPNRKKKSKK